MTEAKKKILAAFEKTKERTGQKGSFAALDNSIDGLIDELNECIDSSPDEVVKEQARQAITGLLNVKEEEVSKLKLLESEARGKGSTRSKERDYTRQLDAAISAIEGELSNFLT